MKKQKKQSLLNAIIIILVIAVIMMIASIVYEEIINMNKQQTQNTITPVEDELEEQVKDIDDKGIVEDTTEVVTDQKDEEKNQVDKSEEKENYVGEEENTNQENTTKSKDEKAIELVKQKYGKDDSVTFSIEQKNGAQYYVAVKDSDTETVWYEVNTETWEVSEY